MHIAFSGQSIAWLMCRRESDCVYLLAKWSVIALTGMAALATEGSLLAADRHAVDRFKGIMSDLPPAGEIVFSVTFANGQEEFYDYRWDNESFAVRKANEMDHLFEQQPDLKRVIAGGRDGSNYWRLRDYPGFGPNLLEWDSERDSSSVTNAVRLPVETLLFFPRAVLCMGVMHLGPGSLRWNGDQFDYSASDQHFSGAVSRDTHSRARELRVTHNADSVRRYVVSYDYGDGDKPDWMPETIQMHLIETGGHLRKLHQFRILKASFDPQPAGHLSPTALIQERIVVTGFLSNNDTYFSRGGQPKRLLRPEEVPAVNNASPMSRSLSLLFLAVAVLAAPAVLAIKAWLWRDKTTPSNHYGTHQL